MATSQGKDLVKKGEAHAARGDFMNAEIFLKQALEYQDTKEEANVQLAKIFVGRGVVSEGVRYFNQALAANPKSFEALSNLGLYYAQMQQFPQAKSFLERAYKVNPNRQEVRLQLAQIKVQLGELDEAEKLVTPLAGPKSRNENAFLLLSQIKALKKDFAGAEVILLNLLKIIPNHPEALINLGQLAEGVGDVEKARTHYHMATKSAPSHYQAKVEYGRFLSNVGALEEGLKFLVDASALQPNDWVVQVHLGNTYQELGEFDKAITAYKKALQHKPDDLGIKQNLSRVLSRFVPPWHLKMLADHERNDVFQRAIEKAVTSDSVVLDIGTGSGILSMMAARAGAEQIYTCEQSTYIAEAALENIKKNGYNAKIKLFPNKSTQIDPEELSPKPNLIIAEIFDAGLLGEHAMPSFRHALNHLCEPNTKVIPKAADIKGKLIHAEKLASVNPMKDISGLDLSAFDQFRIAEEYVTQNLSEITHSFCSDEFDMMSVDFEKPWETFAPGQYRWFDLKIEVTSDLPVHGIAFWFNLHLDDEITLGGEPGRKDNHWGQAVSFFNEPVKAEKGSTLKVPLCYNDIKIWFGQPEII